MVAKRILDQLDISQQLAILNLSVQTGAQILRLQRSGETPPRLVLVLRLRPSLPRRLLQPPIAKLKRRFSRRVGNHHRSVVVERTMLGEEILVIPDQIRRGAQKDVEEIRPREQRVQHEESTKRVPVQTVALERGIREVIVHPGPEHGVEERDECFATRWHAWSILLWRAGVANWHLVVVVSTIGIRRIGLQIGIPYAHDDGVWLAKLNRPPFTKRLRGGLR